MQTKKLRKMAEGILLIDKPRDKTSFYLVHVLRKVTGVKKIGHTGTLDPLATGVMVMLIGSKYTQKTPLFIKYDKEYETTLLLGSTSDTYDIQGKVEKKSDFVPSLNQVNEAIALFQGSLLQIPPMFSAKKQNGKKLYELARQGISVERPPVQVHVLIRLLSYTYPELRLHITCSSGTYVRTIAHDIGLKLSTGAIVSELTRTRSGPFSLTACQKLDLLTPLNFASYLHA